MSRNSKKALFISLPFILLGIVLRFFQLNDGIDFETGFFRGEYGGFASNMIYYLFAAAFLCILGGAIWDKVSKGTFYFRKFTELGSSETILMGIIFLVSGCSVFLPLLNQLTSPSPNPMLIIGMLAGCISYLLIGFLMLGNKKIVPMAGFLMIFLAAYYTIKSTAFFMNNLVITSNSQRLLTMLQILVPVVFFINLGRILLGADGKNTRLGLIVSGLLHTVISFTYVGGSLLLAVVSPAKLVQMEIIPDLESIVLGCVPLFILLIMLRKTKAVPVNVMENSVSENNDEDYSSEQEEDSSEESETEDDSDTYAEDED